MNFERIRPGPTMAPFVEWYWSVESDDPTPRIQKIVPDGYPEFIFHYADPFRIRLNDRWFKQGRALVGGQMLKHFFLENTGATEMFGITFKPAALTHLFQIPMRPLTGKVVDISTLPRTVSNMLDAVGYCKTMSDRIASAETFLQPFITSAPQQHVVDRSLILQREHAGLIPILPMCASLGITDRHLQRLYNKYVGISPKYYSRIIRFSTIFTQMKEGKLSWADVIHSSGYYDQSHFIRDFKAFTGEDPSGFQFQEASLTNFFAGKTRKSDLYNTNRKASA
jgi:AraC-like DNA-binding protein